MAQKIKHWYPKDERFFKTLSVAGNIRTEDANRIDISNSRLKNFVREGLIKQVSYPSGRHGQIQSNRCYAFTKKGKSFVKDKYGIMRVQNASAMEHNCKVAECICNLEKAEIDTIKSEWDVREMWESRLDELRGSERDYWEEKLSGGNLSAVDVVYTSTGGTVCGIEVTTSNYGEAEIEEKEACGELLQMEISYVSVK